jgi:catechol 2,3-dioxygenase
MTNPMQLEAFQAPLHIADVTLAVRDLDAVGAYYVEGLGFSVLSRQSDRLVLGVDGTALLTLEHRPDLRPHRPQDAGLFHTAFLVPGRTALGALLREASRRGIAFDGASDHKVSEALYLSDPEGNGIEVYADRPRATWQPSAGNAVTMTTDPMDAEGVLAAGAGVELDGRMPTGTRIGHIHLCVGDLEAARTFFAGAFGLDVMYARRGAVFFAAGGYHHHVATNIWQSSGAAPKSPETTGLVGYRIQLTDAADLAARQKRFEAAGSVLTSSSGGFSLRDACGVTATLLAPRRQIAA